MTEHITIVAEIGINHNGSLSEAFKLNDIASAAGCDYIKFQKRDPDVCELFSNVNRSKGKTTRTKLEKP